MLILGWLLKLTVLLAGAFVLSRLLRRSAAEVRYRVWIGALAALFVGPVVGRWVRVPVPALPSISIAMQPPILGGTSARGVGEPADVISTPRRSTPPHAGLSPIQMAGTVWLLVVLALIARLAWSAATVKRIISRGKQVHDRSWTNILYETADRLSMNTVPVLLLSDRTAVPLACRLRRPVIVLPANADGWSEDRRRVVLLHELAHVKRRDLIGHALSRLACAVYWFHPLVWFAAQRLRAESERACDDLALEGGAKPSDYAEQLLSLVTELRSDPAPATVMAMAANREFEGRIISILDSDVARRPRSRLQALVPVVTILGFGLVLAVTQPAARAATPSVASAQGRAGVAQLRQDTALLRRLLLTDTSPQVRVSTAWSLHERREAAPLLVTAFRSDRDASVREMAAWALGQLGDTTLLPMLYSQLTAERAAPVRATTAWAIGQLRGSTAALLPLLTDGDVNVVRMAVWAIGQNPPRHAPAAVITHLRHSDRGVRFFAAWSLGEIADPGAVNHLHTVLATERDTVVRLVILRALFESGDRSKALVDAGLQSADPEIRSRAAQVGAGQKPRRWTWQLPLPDPRER